MSESKYSKIKFINASLNHKDRLKNFCWIKLSRNIITEWKRILVKKMNVYIYRLSLNKNVKFKFVVFCGMLA